MTNPQFDALSKLLQLRQGAQREAARLVLVDGLRQADAARAAGCSPSALGNTLRVCRAGFELAKIVCETASPRE
jgi:DNA-directed RNA polymerase specialized sigma24 family protein